MSGCQGTPWSKELDGKEIHEVAWWRLRSRAERIRCFLHIANTVNPPLITCKWGIMLIFKEWCLTDPLNCCTAVTGVTCLGLSSSLRPALSCIRTCDFRTKFASPNPRIVLLFVLSGRVVPENSRSSYPQRVLGLRGVVSLMTARPLEYHSSLN